MDSVEASASSFVTQFETLLQNFVDRQDQVEEQGSNEITHRQEIMGKMIRGFRQFLTFDQMISQFEGDDDIVFIREILEHCERRLQGLGAYQEHSLRCSRQREDQEVGTHRMDDVEEIASKFANDFVDVLEESIDIVNKAKQELSIVLKHRREIGTTMISCIREYFTMAEIILETKDKDQVEELFGEAKAIEGFGDYEKHSLRCARERNERRALAAQGRSKHEEEEVVVDRERERVKLEREREKAHEKQIGDDATAQNINALILKHANGKSNEKSKEEEAGNNEEEEDVVKPCKKPEAVQEPSNIHKLVGEDKLQKDLLEVMKELLEVKKELHEIKQMKNHFGSQKDLLGVKKELLEVKKELQEVKKQLSDEKKHGKVEIQKNLTKFQSVNKHFLEEVKREIGFVKQGLVDAITKTTNLIASNHKDEIKRGFEELGNKLMASFCLSKPSLQQESYNKYER